MKRWRNAAGPAAVAVLVAAIFCTLPLGTALEFGRDEGYELMKGLLHSRGFQLYKEIWSDQPPLFTLLLSAAFGEFGASILVGRLVAAGFGLAFFMTFYSLVRQRSGHWPAAFAAFLLLSSPTVLELSVSVMQEVPAFAVALISAWLLVQWSERRRWPWLLASGAAMGVALEIKLTAAVLVPAMLTQAALAAPAKSNGVRARRTWLGPSLWGAATLGWFLAIALLWGRGSLHAFWGADVAPHAVLGLKRPEDFPIQWSLFLDHAECVVAAVAGTVWALKGGQWKEIAFPLVMLATALGIHAAHRPWWIYYYLHFAVPLSWLAGVGVSRATRGLGRLLGTGRHSPSSPITWKAVLLCLALGLVLARSQSRLLAGVRFLRGRPLAATDPVIAKMKQYAGRTKWAYAQEGIYAFHAGLVMPPELAVVTLKRGWSEKLTLEQIVELCRRYDADQILLPGRRTQGPWKSLLDNRYDVILERPGAVLYLLKERRPLHFRPSSFRSNSTKLWGAQGPLRSKA